ncbi:MAG: holo-[acyl-carrier-protein] synthase [Deltaproteobacteria bacterium]|jgi:holo-[acyl-carrier protein] synthase|nr:MAG: holo-[acyl-carrier-protein] synthase [Deltaproteobacteria bacterium]
MIIGIGIDLVYIPRIKKLLDKWGNTFKKRVFSDNEIAYSEKHLKYENHYAANFAVKEAFFKAIGRGFRFKDIETLRDEHGKPYINLYGEAKKTASTLKISSIHTSISHDGEYSVAVVLLESSP